MGGIEEAKGLQVWKGQPAHVDESRLWLMYDMSAAFDKKPNKWSASNPVLSRKLLEKHKPRLIRRGPTDFSTLITAQDKAIPFESCLTIDIKHRCD